MPADLSYLGAFQVPQTDSYAGVGSQTGPCDLSYRADGDPGGSADGYPGSLFLSNHDFVGEIKIPAPVKSATVSALNVASEIQSAADITGGLNCGPANACDRFGGAAYLGARGSQTTPKLYWSIYEYYNVSGEDNDSIGWSEITLADPQPKGVWHVGPAASGYDAFHGMKYGDYIIPVDQTWADAYLGGRSLLVGRYREAGCCGGSMGPVLTAIAPWQDGNPPANGAKLGALPLMYFDTTPSTTWQKFRMYNDPAWTYYSAGDKWNGGAWVERNGKRAILLAGHHGTYNGTPLCPQTAHGGGCAAPADGAPYCYGDGGTDCPWGIAVTNNHGYHCGPYVPRLVFIDPDDLAAVAQGTLQHDGISAYTVYDPSGDSPWTDVEGFGDLGGVGYDAVNGYLYVMQDNVYQPNGQNTAAWPVILVYQVSGTGTPALPAAPRGLRVR